jgi:hypothetical protein
MRARRLHDCRLPDNHAAGAIELAVATKQFNS